MVESYWIILIQVPINCFQVMILYSSWLAKIQLISLTWLLYWITMTYSFYHYWKIQQIQWMSIVLLSLLKTAILQRTMMMLMKLPSILQKRFQKDHCLKLPMALILRTITWLKTWIRLNIIYSMIPIQMRSISIME